MADQKIQLTVQVNAETGQLEVLGAKLDETGKKAQGTANAFSGLSGEAGGLLKSLLPIATFTGLVAFFTSAVQGAEEQNEAFRRLKFSIEGMGISWEKNREAIEKWTVAISNSTRFSDSDAITALDKLTRVTGSLTQAQTASQLAMGLSVSSGKDLAATTALVTDLLNGNQRSLIEVKREFGNVAGAATDTQQALSALQKAYGDAALTSRGLTDSSAHLKNSFTELKDTIGNALIPVLIPVMDVLRRMIDGFQLLGITIGGLVRSNVAMLKMDFAGMKKIFDETIDSVQNFEQKRTSAVATGESERLTITQAAREKQRQADQQAQTEREQKARENNNKLAAIEADLDRQIAGMKQAGLLKDKAILDAEVNQKKTAIDKEIKGEREKQTALAKLRDFEKAGNMKLNQDQIKIKQDYALQTADLAIQTLQTLNSLGDTGSKAERTRAKALLLLQQSVAIGWAVVAAAKATAETANPAIGAALLAGQIALIAAQTAAGFQRIDRAASNEAQGLQGVTVNPSVPGIDLGGGVFAPPGADRSSNPALGGTAPSAPGTGGNGTVGTQGLVIIHPGAIVINGVNDASKIPDRVVDQIGERLVERIKGQGQTSFIGGN